MWRFSALFRTFPATELQADPAARDCYTSDEGLVTSQSFTFIDPRGNQAQYTIYEADRHNEFHWSTDHGDHGFDPSFAEAQTRARTALKASMTARRRADEQH